MFKFIFSEAGVGLSSVLLIIAGIMLNTEEGLNLWAGFCITLGISLLFFVLASKLKDLWQTITGIIGIGFLIAAAIFFANAL